ncbi:amino acid ABC transporter permease [Amaricoccus solimangrovi]|uniref:ABC transporter permease subunit n=1 Tax=Amaricoccus solimangrovi TaxID=2589815 RepID=A0A501WLQ8_9RHOB|nr:ABC transporter permease subunit [Amaricoccus solimangrovi]TPE50419.1 ABC transporter permease subunit [Amaricoccus solimangrovi]
MAITEAHSREPFRLGMLLYDTRYRSITIQIIALIAVLTFFGWIVHNTVANLHALGKTFDFGFLGQRAGYDISQTLIPYTNDSTHGRAALVGILNTLLVAFLGCVTATIIGVFMGVLRLSSNWLIARLASVYVEMFRNVPVLLWILALMAIITDTLPAPSAFRGENASASMLFGDTVALTNRGAYVPWPIFGPGWQVVAGVFILSLIAILLFRRYAHARQEATGQALPVFWISLALFFLPALAADAVVGAVTLDVPTLQRFNFEGGGLIDKSLVALWFALALYTGAFIAEIVRGGIQAISRGQSEAAGALGLRPNRIMSLVILPQALRIIIPPLISQYLNLTKNSSLAIVVGYADVRATLGGITMNQTGRELECMLLMMGFYLLISLAISSLMNWYNSSIALKER